MEIARKGFPLLVSFFLALTLSLTAAEAAGGMNDCFFYALDASGGAWSLAVAVNMSDRTLIFTSSSGAGNYKDGEAMVEIGDSVSPLYREEGAVFSNGDLFSWRIKGPVGNPSVLSPDQPSQNETVSVFFVGEEQQRLSLDTTISEMKIYDDGTAGFSLSARASNICYSPGYVLNEEGRCVGILYNSSIAYTPWYGEAANAVSSSSGTDLDDDDIGEEPWWKGIGGVAVIGLVAGAVAAFVSASKKRKKITETPKPEPKPPEYPKNDVTTTSDFSYKPPVFEDNFLKTAPVETPQCALAFTGGAMNGAIVPLALGITTIGRDPSCTVRYPSDYPGVSRRHATIRTENGRITLCDTSSTGIFLKRIGGTLQPNQPVQVNVGDEFYLGAESNSVKIIPA